MEFVTELEEEQLIVDSLVSHERCKDIYIERLDDEIMLCCGDCHEVILNYFKKGVID